MSGAIGTLRQRIILQRELPQSLEAGSYQANWTDIATVWGRIEPVNAREILQGARLESRVTHRIIIRYRADLDAGIRALCLGRSYNVQAILDPGEQHRFIQLLTIEGGAT
jgi:SPP1 family predicted phage head-tail adaptor